VTANTLRSVPRHHTDNQRAGDGHQHAKNSQVIAGRGNQRGVPASKIKQIGKEADQAEQRQRYECAEQTDCHREHGDGDYPGGGGEVAQSFVPQFGFGVLLGLRV
jgi:hypothetical protein